MLARFLFCVPSSKLNGYFRKHAFRFAWIIHWNAPILSVLFYAAVEYHECSRTFWSYSCIDSSNWPIVYHFDYLSDAWPGMMVHFVVILDGLIIQWQLSLHIPWCLFFWWTIWPARFRNLALLAWTISCSGRHVGDCQWFFGVYVILTAVKRGYLPRFLMSVAMVAV